MSLGTRLHAYRGPLSEIGSAGFNATVAVAVTFALAEALVPGAAVSVIAPQALAASLAMFGGLALIGRGRAVERSSGRGIAYTIFAIIVVASAVALVWRAASDPPDSRLTLAIATGIIAAGAFYYAR